MPTSLPCPRCKIYHFLLYCVSGFSGRTPANCACLPSTSCHGCKRYQFVIQRLRLLGKNTSKHSTPFSQPSSLCRRFIPGYSRSTSKQCMSASLPCPRCKKLPFSATLCIMFLWQDTNKLCMPASLPCPRCKSYHFLLYCVSGFSGRTPTNCACLPHCPVPGAKSYHCLLYCVSGFSSRTPANCACLPPCPVPGCKSYHFLLHSVSCFSGRTPANCACLPHCPVPGAKSYHCLLYCVSGSLAGHQQTVHACLPALLLVKKLPFSATLCLRFLWQGTSKLCMPASLPSSW
jgi:hypothetical protein